jgi:hypothetical protein
MTALSSPLHTARATATPRLVASTRPRGNSAAVPKLRYIVVTLMGIFGILAVQLMLSIAVSGGAYEIASLKGEMRNTEQKRQIVSEDINALVAPDTLAGLAASMGMVADNNPAYLRLSDSQVVGSAVPASAQSGTQVYPVTSGTETLAPPAIVAIVFESVTTAQDLKQSLEPAAVSSQTVSPVQVSITPASPPVEPPVRFGGNIPSPTTR